MTLPRVGRSPIVLNLWRTGSPGCMLSCMPKALFSTLAEQEHLRVSLQDGLGRITIDRPKALNAKNCGTVKLLSDRTAADLSQLTVHCLMHHCMQKW